MGVFASTVDEPFSEHADTEHRKSFNASGRTLIVAYDPKTGQSTSFFLPGTDPRSLLRIGNLTWAGDYDLEFLRQTGGSTPGLKVVLPTSTVTEESEIQNAKERPVRTWTDAAGNHQIKAAFGGCAFGAVKLTKMSGETITLRVDQLSEKDQEWIHKRIGRK